MADLVLNQKKTIPSDPVLKLLHEHGWGLGREASAVSKQIHASDLVFSVWDGTQLAAFCRVLTDYSYVVSVWDFIVAKDHLGRGLGDRLLKALMGHPDLIGIKKWTLSTPMNVDFFEQHGFLAADDILVRYG